MCAKEKFILTFKNSVQHF